MTKKKTALAAALLLVFSLAAYANTFRSEFHFDDFHQLVNNRHIRDLANIPGFFRDAGMGSNVAELKSFRPLTYASFALNYAASGYGVAGYHAVNLTLHFLCSLIVFLIVGEVLKESGRGNPFQAALAASLVFALHPVQTSAVTYVSGRAALLSSLFVLLAFFSFVRFRAGHGGRRYLWAASSLLFFLLGLLSKEAAVALLGLIAAYDFIFTLPKKAASGKAAKAGLYYIPFVAVLALYLAARKALLGFTAVEGKIYGVGEYLMSEAGALVMYIRLMALPVNQNADYDLPLTTSPDARVAASVLLLALAAVLLYRLRRVNPAASFFGSWFFLALAPESSLIPITDIAVEYRLYLPVAGFASFLVLAGADMLKSSGLRRWSAVSVLIMLGLLTFSRNGVWATEHTFWSDVLRKSPHSARAHANMGGVLLDEKRYPEAIGELERSLDINPLYSQSNNVYDNLGICLFELGMVEEAITQFNLAIKVYPGDAKAHSNIGAAYFKLGRYEEALDAFTRASLLDPGYARGHFNLARAYSKLGRDKDATREMDTALKRAPMDLEMRKDAEEFMAGPRDY